MMHAKKALVIETMLCGVAKEGRTCCGIVDVQENFFFQLSSHTALDLFALDKMLTDAAH